MGGRPEFHGASCDEFFEDVGTAVDLVRGVSLLGCTQVSVDRRYPCVCLHVIEPDAFHPDGGVSVPEVEECTRGAHRPERPGRDNVDLFQRSFLSEFVDNSRHLVGGNDPCITVAYPGIDEVEGLFHERVFILEYL